MDIDNYVQIKFSSVPNKITTQTCNKLYLSLKTILFLFFVGILTQLNNYILQICITERHYGISFFNCSFLLQVIEVGGMNAFYTIFLSFSPYLSTVPIHSKSK